MVRLRRPPARLHGDPHPPRRPRKLTGDIRWPAWKPINEALGPLAGAFPLLSLRTTKADVAVGVPKEVAERLDAAEESWRVDGR